MDPLDPTATKAKLLRELVSHMKGGMADDLKSKYSPAPEPELPVEAASDEVAEEGGGLGDPGAPEGLEMNGEAAPLDDSVIQEYIAGMDPDALAKLLGGEQ